MGAAIFVTTTTSRTTRQPCACARQRRCLSFHRRQTSDAIACGYGVCTAALSSAFVAPRFAWLLAVKDATGCDLARWALPVSYSLHGEGIAAVLRSTTAHRVGTVKALSSPSGHGFRWLQYSSALHASALRVLSPVPCVRGAFVAARQQQHRQWRASSATLVLAAGRRSATIKPVPPRRFRYGAFGLRARTSPCRSFAEVDPNCGQRPGGQE